MENMYSTSQEAVERKERNPEILLCTDYPRSVAAGRRWSLVDTSLRSPSGGGIVTLE